MGEVLALVALLSAIALSPELQDRHGRHAKNCDPVSVLPVRTSRLSGEPSSSRFPRVGSACTVLLHPHCWHLTAVSWHLTAVSWHRTAGPSLLAPLLLSGSPRWVAPLAFFTCFATYSTVATRCGYPGSWYSTASLTWTTLRGVPI